MDQPETADRADPESTPEAPKLPSLPTRALNVFFSPGEVMAGLKDNPAWVGALVVGAALTVSGAVLLPAEILEATMRQQIIERGGSADNIETMARIGRIVGIGGAAVFWFVMSAAMAGLLTLIFAFILGDRGRYKQYLAVLAHAFLISAVGVLAVLPLKIAAQDASLLLSVGTFLPFLEEGYFARVLGFVDLFGLWSWAVVGIGVAALEPKRTVGGAVGIVMVIPIALAMIFGIFGG
ncbi:MAG: YIP1 family protein [Gemmatimonadetes bacterium]|nr:YIP1 family protein [Gemmatimonadota bacterium]